jgi:hypothetical protein
MSSLAALTVIGLVAVGFLVWLLARVLQKDHLDARIANRKGSSRLATRADYVEGTVHMPVAIAVSDSVFYYENDDLQAQLDLSGVDEVEYDDELSFGKDVHNGAVLRIRSHGRKFEFIIDEKNVSAWNAQLPPHRMSESPMVH